MQWLIIFVIIGNKIVYEYEFAIRTNTDWKLLLV